LAVDQEPSDSLESAEGPKTSEILLAAIKTAEKALADYNATCDKVDRIYSLQGSDIFADDGSPDFQIFW
jgi:hypothetical protein